MPRLHFKLMFLALSEAAAVLVLSRYGLWGLAVALVLGLELARLWRRKQLSVFGAASVGPEVILGASFAALIALSTQTSMQVILTVVYGVVLMFLRDTTIEERGLGTAALVEFIGLLALFDIEAAPGWRWPRLVILLLSWAISFVAAQVVLAERADRLRTAIASGWALVAAELAYVFTIWQVNYAMPAIGRLLASAWLVIPQPAVVITGVGYCFAGIYQAHSQSKLSKSRLTEYILIGLALLAIVITGTKWNGTI